MKNIVGLLLMLLLAKQSFTQSTDSSLVKLYTQAVRFNVLSLLDPFDGNLSVGGEYAFHPRLSVTTDLSFIFYSLYFQNKKWSLGYIIKPAFRYYFSDKRRGFVEATIFYKKVGYKMEDWLDREVVNGWPTYQKYEEFVSRKFVLGTDIQTGLQRSISKDKRFRIEMYAGMGIRFKWTDIKGKPDAEYESANIFFPPTTGNDYIILPSVPKGVRLVYCIK